MDPNTGELYNSLEEAKEAGVENPVEIIGRKYDIDLISKAVKRAARKKRRQQQKLSRKINRDVEALKKSHKR